jgi:gliding motility-associated-like protein
MNNYSILKILLALVLSHNIAFGQKQSYNWIFESGIELDFNFSPPVVSILPHTMYGEGSSSFSDGCGNLLFYTNGLTVWNKNHTIMDNGTGLNGRSSSTQSTIIVPKPGSEYLYYIFTNGTSDNNFVQPLSYSEVDMSKNSGLGKVVSKNIFLYNNRSEQLTAAKHGNKQDYWLITRESNNNTLLAFLINNSGVNPIPISSSTLSSIADNTQLKISQDGKKVASGGYNGNYTSFDITIASFDNLAGTYSNIFSFQTPAVLLNNPTGQYGLEFSPNGKLLYVTQLNFRNSFTNLSRDIYQYQIDLVPSSAIENSRIKINPDTATIYNQIQMGPDGKLYVNWGWGIPNPPYIADSLAYIEFPDLIGSSCGFNKGGLYLNGAEGFQQLPNIIAGTYLHQTNITSINLCLGDSTEFSPDNNSCVSSTRWNFGDPGSGTNDSSNLRRPKHYYPAAGDYTVTLITESDTVQKTITILDYPTVNLGSDTSICEGAALILDAQNVPAGYRWNTLYQWNTGETSEVISVADSGQYKVSVNNSCFISSDSVTINVIPKLKVDLPKLQIICDEDSISLDAGNPGSKYIWSNGDTTMRSNAFNPGGNYWINISNTCFSISSNFSISFIESDPMFTNENLISPNGDNLNDSLIVLKNMSVEDYKLEIYNRWGNKVFETKDPFIHWSGDVSDGIYYYSVKLINCKKENIHSKGMITVIK